MLSAALLLPVPSVLAGTGKAPASSAPPSPEKLWQQYPLGTKRQPIKARPVRATRAARIVNHVRPVNAVGDESSVVPALGITLAAFALLLLTLTLVRRLSLFPAVVHIRPEGVAMPMFSDRKALRTEPESEQSDHLMASRVSRYTAGDNSGPSMAPKAEGSEQTSEFAQLGKHVGAVLEAAKEAAKKMRLQAKEEARQIRVDAEDHARIALEEAQKQAKQVEADTALLNAQARKESTKIRNEAEAYAVTIRETADKEAAAVLDRAERQGSERINATQAQLRTLDENVAGTEQRLGQLVGKLRELASSLEVLVSGPAQSEQPERMASQTDQGSLTGALTRSVKEQRLATQSKTESL